MAARKVEVVALAVLGLTIGTVQAQFLYNIHLRGASYQTNADGAFTKTKFTGETILRDLAAPVGITNLSTLALVYHINANPFGDAIEVVNPANGMTLDTVFGFYYGDSLGRVALTNGLDTVERRVDYIYDTKQSPDALGSAFLIKRYVKDAQGNTQTIVQAQMQYLVRPQGTNSARICVATFATSKPFKPSGP